MTFFGGRLSLGNALAIVGIVVPLGIAIFAWWENRGDDEANAIRTTAEAALEKIDAVEDAYLSFLQQARELAGLAAETAIPEPGAGIEPDDVDRALTRAQAFFGTTDNPGIAERAIANAIARQAVSATFDALGPFSGRAYDLYLEAEAEGVSALRSTAFEIHVGFSAVINSQTTRSEISTPLITDINTRGQDYLEDLTRIFAPVRSYLQAISRQSNDSALLRGELP